MKNATAQCATLIIVPDGDTSDPAYCLRTGCGRTIVGAMSEPKDKPTKAENDGLARHLKQMTMFLTEPERVENAYRAGFRAGRTLEAKKLETLVKKMAKK